MQDILYKNVGGFLAGFGVTGLITEIANLRVKEKPYENYFDDWSSSYKLFANLAPTAAIDASRILDGTPNVFNDNIGWIAGTYAGYRIRNIVKGASRFYDVLKKDRKKV